MQKRSGLCAQRCACACGERVPQEAQPRDALDGAAQLMWRVMARRSCNAVKQLEGGEVRQGVHDKMSPAAVNLR